MKTAGIIAEYDPFHGGHARLISACREIKGCEAVVSVMSGDFTQRGTPAVFDKWTRATEAVRRGVDLVIELPAIYACANAGIFAAGAVKLLESLGLVDVLAFGSESGDLMALGHCASELARLERDGRAIREAMAGGISYPKAREEALTAALPAIDTGLLRLPNNILAIEYMKHIRRMEAFTIKRTGPGYHESSTEIRRKLRTQDPGRFDRAEDRYFALIRNCFLSMDEAEAARYSSLSEGLCNRIKKVLRLAKSREELINRAKSKRYTYSRISRALCEVLIGADDKVRAGLPVYVRPLAFTRKGAELIKRIRNSADAPVFVGSPARVPAGRPGLSEAIAVDTRASDIYCIISGMDLYRDSDYVRRPELIL